MRIIRKDAPIVNTGDDGPGAFEVVLSSPTKDRDGETLLPGDWKQPLPEHITFDVDHQMTVAGTVGSGVPRIDEKSGNLIVAGTYSSLPLAQQVRTLVAEGHIRTTSVAFMTEKAGGEKDGNAREVRELLNGSFVSIPSNREALILSSKDVGVKLGARNSASDAAHVQAIHDHSLALGADPKGGTPPPKPAAEPPAPPKPAVPKPGPPKPKAAMVPAPTPDALDEPAADGADPATLALAVDAAMDQAGVLLTDVDLTALPDPVQQALTIYAGAEETLDQLLDALGATDPDDDESAPAAPPPPPSPAAGKRAARTDTPGADAVAATYIEILAAQLTTEPEGNS